MDDAAKEVPISADSLRILYKKKSSANFINYQRGAIILNMLMNIQDTQKKDDIIYQYGEHVGKLILNLCKYSNLDSNIKYMVCRNYRRLGCMASGKMTPTGEFISVNDHHTHPREEDDIRTAEFKIQLKEACIRERSPIKNIYEQTAARNREAAINLPFRSIRSSMLRWKKITPNIPANLEKLAAILQSGSVKAGGNCAFILGSGDFIRNFRESQYTFIDGTFKADPRRPHMQILTVFATYKDHVFPIIYIFMESRTRILYDAVFGYLQRTFPHFLNDTVVTDYETALVNSLRAFYPNASLHGCVFDYCQAILRTAHSLGILPQMEENGKLLIKKIYALALLPAEHIVQAFESLQDDIELAGISKGLLEYVKNEWIDRVTPQNLSVFRQIHRTNNVMESYHRRLNNKLVKNPGLWGLMDALIDIQNTASIELEQLERGGGTFKVATKNVVFNNRLNEAWDRLADGRYNVKEFLTKSLNFVESLGMQLYDCNLDIPNHEDPDLALVPLVPNAAGPIIVAINPQSPSALIEPPTVLDFQAEPPVVVARPPSPRPPYPQTTPRIPIEQPLAVYFQEVPTVITALARPPLPHPSSPHTPPSASVEPPPLLYFQAESPVIAPRLPSIPVEPPPLIYFQAEPPVVVARPLSPYPPSPHTSPSIPIERPPSLHVQAEPPLVAARPPSPPTPSPPPPSPRPLSSHTPPLIPIEPPLVAYFQGESTVVAARPSRTPSPCTPLLPEYNFSPNPEETGMENEILLEDVHRWEPRFPATEFIEESMPSVLRCTVCHLNKMQYFMTCGHAFCTSCTFTLFNVKMPRCRICRTEWKAEPLPLYLIR